MAKNRCGKYSRITLQSDDLFAVARPELLALQRVFHNENLFFLLYYYSMAFLFNPSSLHLQKIISYALEITGCFLGLGRCAYGCRGGMVHAEIVR